jgi:hypothetical protein
MNKEMTMKKLKTLTLAVLLCGATTSLWAQTTGDIMVSNALDFLKTPYVAHTLEVNDTEQLVINTDEVDCTTLVEYVLAQTLAKVENGVRSESDFADRLQKIRYRDGKIDGYPSRLHYTSEWIMNGVKGGWLTDVTATEMPDTKKIDVYFMTTHPENYKHMKDAPDNVEKMKAVEQRLTGQEFHYIPKEALPDKGFPWIQNGDIIGIVTNMPGLDIAHLGIAFYVKDTLCLIHASSTQKKVVASRISLAQMLKNNEKWVGIRVLRAKK